MISLMRRLRARQNSIPDVVFVSPDPEERKRAETLFGKQVTQFNNLSKYLES
jgi:phosphoribosylpyrophosphate synthetase